MDLSVTRRRDSNFVRPGVPAYGRQPNPVFSEAYRPLRETIAEARRAAGLPQRELARRLGKCASHVALIERGQRRVDALELYRIAVALELDPIGFFTSVAARLSAHTAPATAANDDA